MRQINWPGLKVFTLLCSKIRKFRVASLRHDRKGLNATLCVRIKFEELDVLLVYNLHMSLKIALSNQRTSVPSVKLKIQFSECVVKPSSLLSPMILPPSNLAIVIALSVST